MTSMNQEEALVYLMKPSRNSTANRNIACACGVHKHFAVPIGPTSGVGQQGEAPGGSFARLLPLQGCCMELPLLHPSSTSNTAFTLPQGQEKEAKSLYKEAGISQHSCLLHCASLASTQHIHGRCHRSHCPVADMPCIPPGRDVCFP